MIHTLQDYIQKLQGLQDGKQAPHKPFLLLIIIEMLESGELSKNCIPFGEIEKKKPFFADLISVFNGLNRSNWKPNIHIPFFHLKTNGFWHLEPLKLQSKRAETTPTAADLRNANPTAKLDEDLFYFLCIPESRKIIRQTLIDSCFPAHREKIDDLFTQKAEFNDNLDEVDFNNFIIDKGQPSLFSPEPEEEEQGISEGEHRYFVYAWRWCGDEGFAKIGRTRNGLKGVENRMVTTYHPTDDPVLLGVRECADAEESHKIEQYILKGLGRTRPDREWVEIDEKFNEMIAKSFMASQED